MRNIPMGWKFRGVNLPGGEHSGGWNVLEWNRRRCESSVGVKIFFIEGWTTKGWETSRICSEQVFWQKLLMFYLFILCVLRLQEQYYWLIVLVGCEYCSFKNSNCASNGSRGAFQKITWTSPPLLNRDIGLRWSTDW